MATFEARIKSSMRRGSAIEIQSNPLETSALSPSGRSFKVEAVGSSHSVIDTSQFMDLLTKLRSARDNTHILEILEAEKQPYLFNSTDLLAILDLTTSVKTRLLIILSLAPRLTDPRTKMDTLVGLFRFSEEKSQVEEALKTRVQAINHAVFKVNEGSPLLSAGRGGR
eukprot:gene45790-56044_t